MCPHCRVVECEVHSLTAVMADCRVGRLDPPPFEPVSAVSTRDDHGTARVGPSWAGGLACALSGDEVTGIVDHEWC